MWFFLPLALWPLIEIGLFVTLGAWLGLWVTLAWVLGTAALGFYLIRRQGERAQIAMRRGIMALSDPVSPMAEGAMTFAAGALLILPGFLSDTLGLLLLIPFVRSGLVALLSRRIVVPGQSYARPSYRPDVIDGEFIEIDPDKTRPAPGAAGRSGWTQE